MDEQTFLIRQTEVLEHVVNALIEATPEWWTRATLELSSTAEGCAHTITSEEHPTDIVSATDELFGATYALENLFRQGGKPWRRAVINAWTEGDAWKYSADYQY